MKIFFFFVSHINVSTNILQFRRRPHDGVRSKNNDNVKRRFNSPDVDGWQKKPVPAEAFNAHAASVVSPNVQQSRINPSITPLDNSLGKSEGESLTEELDSMDSQAQVIYHSYLGHGLYIISCHLSKVVNWLVLYVD